MKRKLFERNLPCKLDFKLLKEFIDKDMNKVVDEIIEDEFSSLNEPKIKNNRISIKSFMKYKNFYCKK